MPLTKKRKSKYKLSSEEQKSCHKIIHKASTAAAAAAAGLAQIPLADTTVITPIQITMIISLGKVFGQEVSKATAKGILGSMIASYVGRSVAQVGWGWIPIVGNTSNAIVAATITEALGWLSVDHFYQERYKKGTSTVTEERPNNSANSNKGFSEDLSVRNSLKKSAERFLNGELSVEEHMKEFTKLLDDIEFFLRDKDKNDELFTYQRKLLEMF